MNAKAAFTITALGAVVIIAAQTGTATSGAKRADAKSDSLSRIKQLSTGMMIYITDADDVFPYPQAEKGWQMPLYPYLKNKEIYKTTNPAKPGNFRISDNIRGVSAVAIGEPAKTPLFYDPTAWPDGSRLYSRTDTSSKFTDAAGWKEAEKFMKLKIKKSAKPLPKNYGASFKL